MSKKGGVESAWIDKSKKYLRSFEKEDLLEFGADMLTCREMRNTLSFFYDEGYGERGGAKKGQFGKCDAVLRKWKKMERTKSKYEIAYDIFSFASAKQLEEMANRYDEG